MRIDRFLSSLPQGSRKQARTWLAKGQVMVEDEIVNDPLLEVTPFTQIRLNGQALQTRQARYLMLHKPQGYLSATRDPQHPTVIELLNEPQPQQLHIGGRLDRASTGLLLITDDGRWSRHLTEPDKKIAKVYRVETANDIDPDTARRFEEGIYFGFEDITTKPVQLEQLGPRLARLTLIEGRYHQIKRMFGRFRNPVIALHREKMGAIALDPALAPGEYRHLTAAEIDSIGVTSQS
ncbi:MAG: 16S rRNA pseudouridine(516) synthase [Motiliproteus sp.]